MLAAGSSLGATPGSADWGMRTGMDGDFDRESQAIDKLLEALDELRELDRQRHAHAPGSSEFDAETRRADALSERMMDRAGELHVQRNSRHADASRDIT